MQLLKQSTAVDVLIGPFVDSTDAYTAETGLSPAVKLSKNGQALAAKNDATTPAHDADGYYNCELDATDTNTVGTLVLTVVGSATALGVRHEFQVVEEAIYDALFAGSAAGFDASGNVTLKSGTHTGAVVPSVTTVTGNVNGSVGSVTGAVGSVTGNVGGSVASVTGAVGSVTGNVGGSVASVTAGVTVSANNDKTGYSLTVTPPTAVQVRQEIDSNSTQLAALVADGPNTITKGVALANFPFLMVDGTDFATPETGLTVSGTISKDGGAFAALTNSVTEIGNGAYKVTFTAAEMNADTILVRFTATGAADRFVTITTQPT